MAILTANPWILTFSSAPEMLRRTRTLREGGLLLSPRPLQVVLTTPMPLLRCPILTSSALPSRVFPSAFFSDPVGSHRMPSHRSTQWVRSDHNGSSVVSHLVAKDIISDRFGSDWVHFCACVRRLEVGEDWIASDGMVSTRLGQGRIGGAPLALFTT